MGKGRWKERFQTNILDGQISKVFSPNFIISFIGSKSLINTVFSSGYKVFGAFFIYGKTIVQVSLNTAKHRLKSLQIEYYSSHKLSKMSIRKLQRSLLKSSEFLKSSYFIIKFHRLLWEE